MTANPEFGTEISQAYWTSYGSKPIGTEQNLVFSANGHDQVQLIRHGGKFAVVSLVYGSVEASLPFDEATRFAETYVSEMYEGPKDSE